MARASVTGRADCVRIGPEVLTLTALARRLGVDVLRLQALQRDGKRMTYAGIRAQLGLPAQRHSGGSLVWAHKTIEGVPHAARKETVADLLARMAAAGYGPKANA